MAEEGSPQQVVYYKTVDFFSVPDPLRDACIAMYWHCDNLLKLGAWEKDIPLQFIELTDDPSKAVTDWKGRIKGYMDSDPEGIYIGLGYPLSDTLFTLAHEMAHVAQLRKGGMPGLPVILMPYLESEADAFASQACRSFNWRLVKSRIF